MYTLGINAAFHDSSACLVKDGKVIAAAEDERFTRIKHGKRPIPFSTYELPFHAIDYCLKEAGIHLNDVDHIAYSFDPYPLLKTHAQNEVITLPLEPSAKRHAELGVEEWEAVWDPLFLSAIVNARRHLAGGWPHHLQKRFIGARFDGPYQWHYVPHHLAHAASAFHASPFEEAAVLTLDGRGERATTTYGHGRGTQIELLGQVDMPHSLGMLYEEITTHLGFLHSSDEYKVMALASYGKPEFLDVFRKMIRIREDGTYTIQRVNYEEAFGPKRLRGAELEAKHFNIAHSLQKVLEESVLEIARILHAKTMSNNLCMAGGVALNCVMNARVRDEGPYKNIWVQPAAGDAGTSLGAALWVDAKSGENREKRLWSMNHAFWGPSFDENEIEEFLLWSKVPYRRMRDVARETSELLARDKIIGWFQGRMEFGPRALGARSILASPISPDMQARLNDIKEREDFRPVAPVVLEEEADEWFKNAGVSPFMLFVHEVRPEKAAQIPAVRHVDGTARVQTIRRDQNPVYYDLLKAFQARTGVPVLVNTSFNTRSEPVVCTPRDAIECFWSSPLDALAIGPFLLEKGGFAQGLV
ncbi:MAG: carbamoyltransferase [Bdellovibrionia bacterium]